MNASRMHLVIKIGTAALSGSDGAPDEALLDALAAQIAALKKAGHYVILVSSGAVGVGRSLAKNFHASEPGGKSTLKSCDEVATRQILAALGQAQLMTIYQAKLAPHGIAAAQILLTKQDFRTRDHHKHMAHLFGALAKQAHILPIINENDSVTANELMFSDNDELAGLLAAMIGADRLIILSHIAGVYDRAPDEPGARVIPLIDWQAKKGVPGEVKGKSSSGRGGMQSKLGIARKMASLGIRTHIASAREDSIIARLLADEPVGTAVAPRPDKRNAVKRWLASETALAPASVTANECLAAKMRDGSQAISLLPVGLTGVQGEFGKGDLVKVVDDAGNTLALGVARYNDDALRRALGKKQQPVFIHYDQLHRVGE
jgi:glutamate 5-kinase